MTTTELLSYVVSVAREKFSNQLFGRRELMNAVEVQLRGDGKWPEEYDLPSGSKGKKSKGLARIDYAFIPLKNDGRFTLNNRDQWSVAGNSPDIDCEFIEGGKVTISHLKIERDPEATRIKKISVLKSTGSLVCEICEFDFVEKYGSLGQGFAECHHLVPLSALKGKESKTSMDGLIITCSNCHRMIHKAISMNKKLHDVEKIKMAILNGKRRN